MAELYIAKESVWFEQGKFEGAETRYQEILAERHSGLAIEGKAVPIEGKTDGAVPVESKAAPNHITSQFEKAKSFIQESLKTVAGSRAGSNMEQRIAQLEKENNELKSTLQAVQSRLCLLEGRVGKLDGEATETKAPPPAESKPPEDEEDDFDLFGSDDEEVDAEAEKLKQQRLEAYQEKKTKKGQVIAKSNIILEVKPWDDETDMKDIEKVVRAVETDGLKWGASKLVPVGYGIMKLQITCVVEDDKVGTDFLEESITAHEDLVQSVDIVAFNKI